jgi:hypothetical protein
MSVPSLLRRTLTATLLASLVLGTMVAPTFAGKPSGSTTASNSLQLVIVTSADSTVSWGDQVTFKVTTSYQYPTVSVTCTQNGVKVLGDSRPMYQPNAFNDPGIFTLSSQAWTGGAASCTAALKVQKKSGVSTIATLSFSAAG